MCDARTPTEKELVYHENKMKNYFLRIVRIADSVWAGSGRQDMIDGRCKIAANYLKIKDRKWLMDYVPNMTCPACKESIIEGASLCRFCGTILDDSAVRVRALHGRDDESLQLKHWRNFRPSKWLFSPPISRRCGRSQT